MNHQHSLEDKYCLEGGRAYMTGTQALVRLPMLQRQRDQRNGHNTAGYISGYRGSPLGGFDKALWQAQAHLKDNHVHFQPGVNEDLAATSVWGSQQVNRFPDANCDGVFAMWYGKGPGVDRSGDVFKHANAAGTSPLGGVLAIAGDDHNCKSSTLPHQSEYAFIDAMMPILSPSGVQEILDMGILGWALSRYCGSWVGFKTIAEIVDSSISALIDPDRIRIQIPDDFDLPEEGLHLRWPDAPLEQEQRIHQYKLKAAQAFARANALDRVVMDCTNPRIGIITSGKAYLDVLQALDDLQISPELAESIGLTVYKVGMTWPLETTGIRRFAKGLEELMVVEEKRGVIESQVKAALYGLSDQERPAMIVGKEDEQGNWLLPPTGELSATQVATVLATRFDRFFTSVHINKRLQLIKERASLVSKPHVSMLRTPYFCSGCPHNTSTQVPEGSRAMAGIGCHYMVNWMDRRTETFTQMGGEGATWIGQAPFTKAKHVFQNLGDGTYFHSGFLALRAAVAANVNITYKILYNDAVAMTGGQQVDGQLTVPQLSWQVNSEGIKRIVVVTDDPEKYADMAAFAPGVTVHHRDELDHVQKTLREYAGVSVLIYDQVCATEKRRRIKRGELPKPVKRAFINEAVCEGCGDCSVQSNCLSLVPVETEYGRKRAIDQSSCNTDLSCLNGFCPSFVTVNGGDLRQPELTDMEAPVTDLPEPTLPSLEHPYNILVTGVGGTGIVTVGALIGMAAHIEGKGCSVLDMTGLAQKFGAVLSHLRLGQTQDALHGTRVGAGAAHALIGCDLVVSTGDAALSCLSAATRGVVNSHESMPPEFIHKPDLQFPVNALEQTVIDATQKDNLDFIDATGIATKLLGDSIYANLFIVGFAYQRGLIPIAGASIEAAIQLNGVSTEKNKRAFRWGRVAACDRALLPTQQDSRMVTEPMPERLEDVISAREKQLTAYQNKRYAARYHKLVEAVCSAVKQKAPDKGEELALAVAVNYAKVLSYKDEYEVARLYTTPSFKQALEQTFTGNYTLAFHFAAPLLAKKDPHTGLPKKRRMGAWAWGGLGVLAKLKGLRGSVFDPFAYTHDRRLERQIISDYEVLIDTLIIGLTPDNYSLAVELASLPQGIRGFGHIKKQHYDVVKNREVALLKQFTGPGTPTGGQQHAA